MSSTINCDPGIVHFDKTWNSWCTETSSDGRVIDKPIVRSRRESIANLNIHATYTPSSCPASGNTLSVILRDPFQPATVSEFAQTILKKSSPETEVNRHDNNVIFSITGSDEKIQNVLSELGVSSQEINKAMGPSSRHRDAERDYKNAPILQQTADLSQRVSALSQEVSDVKTDLGALKADVTSLRTEVMGGFQRLTEFLAGK